MKECREEHNKLLNISYNCEVGIVCNEEQYFCCNKYFRTNKNNIAYTIVGNYRKFNIELQSQVLV